MCNFTFPFSCSASELDNKGNISDAEHLLPMILNQIQNKSDSRLRPKIGRTYPEVSNNVVLVVS